MPLEEAPAAPEPPAPPPVAPFVPAPVDAPVAFVEAPEALMPPAASAEVEPPAPSRSAAPDAETEARARQLQSEVDVARAELEAERAARERLGKQLEDAREAAESAAARADAAGGGFVRGECALRIQRAERRDDDRGGQG
jgi:hypothetical protein